MIMIKILFSPYEVDHDCYFDGDCNYLLIN